MAASVLSRAARRTSSTQVAGPSERVGPRVRIHLPPAASPERTRNSMRLAVGTAAFRSAMPRIATAQRTASTTLRAHQYRRALTTAEPTIGLLRHRAADLPQYAAVQHA